MGDFFANVNIKKRQCMDAEYFDGSFYGAVGVVLGYLLRVTAQPSIHPLIGAWAGDPLVHSSMFAATIHSDADEEWRGLYFSATDEYTDISQQAIAMLCEADPKWAEGLAEWLATVKYVFNDCRYNRILLSYGYAALHQGSINLRDAIMRHIGPVWLEDYRLACKEFEGLSDAYPIYAHIAEAGIPEQFNDTRKYDQEAHLRHELNKPFLLVNLAKGQYLDSERFGITNPYHAIGHKGIEAAFGHLIFEIPADDESPEFAAARWANDLVIAVGYWPGIGHEPADDYEYTLYEKARKEYRDISDSWDIPFSK